MNSCMNDKSLWICIRKKRSVVYFCWDVAEAPCCFIRILTTVEQEENPQVGSLLLISLGPISNGYTHNTKTWIRNSRISIGVIMIYFWCSLPSLCSMCKKPTNDTFADSCLVLASRVLYIIRQNTGQKNQIIKSIYIFFLYDLWVYYRRVGFGCIYR